MQREICHVEISDEALCCNSTEVNFSRSSDKPPSQSNLNFSALMLYGGGKPADFLSQLAVGITYIFVNLLFFLMVYTGKTYRYRSVLFITIAICFVITFITNLIELRGSMVLTKENMISGETPFCHLVIPMVIIPAAITRTIIFPGSITEGFAPVSAMIVIWLGASLALGRGWCSWVCFFGGMDEFFSAVTEFAEITSFKILIQAIIFFSLFAGLVVILPFLTRRRIQCGLFCPFAAFQSFTNKINVFSVHIDREKCIGCGRCIQNCPTFSLDETSTWQGKTLMSCAKCGRCVDTCPKQAVSFHIKGTPAGAGGDAARLLFLFPAFLFAVTIGGSMISGALVRLFKFITTGSMI